MGQVVKKSTTIATKERILHEVDGLRCNHADGHKDAKVKDSATLSRYPMRLQWQLAKRFMEEDTESEQEPQRKKRRTGVAITSIGTVVTATEKSD